MNENSLQRINYGAETLTTKKESRKLLPIFIDNQVNKCDPFNKLKPRLKPDKCDKCNTIKRDGTKKKKLKLIEALKARYGIVSLACDEIGINRSTFYRWCNDDEEFRQSVADIEDVAVDFVESKLFELITNGNVAATIFYLKTKGKARGYSERHQVEIEAHMPEPDFSKLSDEELKGIINKTRANLNH